MLLRHAASADAADVTQDVYADFDFDDSVFSLFCHAIRHVITYYAICRRLCRRDGYDTPSRRRFARYRHSQQAMMRYAKIFSELIRDAAAAAAFCRRCRRRVTRHNIRRYATLMFYACCCHY